MNGLDELLPSSLAPICVTFALSFLIGLEREETSSGRRYNFGGVRTFPIIGLCGYLLARLTDAQPAILGIGVLVMGMMMALSYRKKLQVSTSGMTSEVSGLFTFLLGALVYRGALWEATALAVIVLLVLELKDALESLARKIPIEEIFTFTRFLLISAVILPIVPNRDFTSLHLNPFHTWLIVVAISGLSYLAYVFERIFSSKKGVLMMSILGGLYSSTSTTLVLARQSHDSNKSSALLSGGILISSGFMYFRLLALMSLFNWDLARPLLIPFLALGSVFCAIGGFWMKLGDPPETNEKLDKAPARNPLALRSALLFAVLFSAMSLLTALALDALGSGGVYGVAFLSGTIDVDPFVMSLTQGVQSAGVQSYALAGVIIAAASNNVMKGIYAAVWGKDGVRKHASFAMIVLAVLSLLSLLIV